MGAPLVAELCARLDAGADVPDAGWTAAVDAVAGAHAEFSMEIRKVLAADGLDRTPPRWP